MYNNMFKKGTHSQFQNSRWLPAAICNYEVGFPDVSLSSEEILFLSYSLQIIFTSTSVFVFSKSVNQNGLYSHLNFLSVEVKGHRVKKCQLSKSSEPSLVGYQMKAFLTQNSTVWLVSYFKHLLTRNCVGNVYYIIMY